MKHHGEIEEHVFDWLNEGYSIPQIHDEMDHAIKRFRKTLGYHDVEEYYKAEKVATTEQKGEDCIVTLAGTYPKVIRDCNALKFANTLWDKPGEKYTEEEMAKWRFVLKSGNDT